MTPSVPAHCPHCGASITATTRYSINVPRTSINAYSCKSEPCKAAARAVTAETTGATAGQIRVRGKR